MIDYATINIVVIPIGILTREDSIIYIPDPENPIDWKPFWEILLRQHRDIYDENLLRTVTYNLFEFYYNFLKDLGVHKKYIDVNHAFFNMDESLQVGYILHLFEQYFFNIQQKTKAVYEMERLKNFAHDLVNALNGIYQIYNDGADYFTYLKAYRALVEQIYAIDIAIGQFWALNQALLSSWLFKRPFEDHFFKRQILFRNATHLFLISPLFNVTHNMQVACSFFKKTRKLNFIKLVTDKEDTYYYKGLLADLYDNFVNPSYVFSAVADTYDIDDFFNIDNFDTRIYLTREIDCC